MRNKLFYLISLLLVAAVLTACGSAALAQAQTPEPVVDNGKVTRTISVNGSGKAYLNPDIAYVTIGVHNEGEDAAETMAQNSAETQELVDALRAEGIDPKDIQTVNFSIYPQQQWDERGRPTGEITYIVDNQVQVTVRDLDSVGELLDAAVQAGANSIQGISFDVADKTAALSDARRAAIADARVIAQELAEAAGVELGEVVTINQFNTGYPGPIIRGAGGVMEAAAADVPVSPGQMVISVEVNVVYAIE